MDRKRKLRIAILVTALGALLAVGAGVAIWLLSSGTPQAISGTIREAVQPTRDSGIVACEALRDSIEESETTDDTADVFTEDEYQIVRKMFADSEHEAIRTNGAELIDLGWQMEQMKDENGEVGMEAFALLTPFMEAYSGLSGGCAEQGIIIPPLDFGTEQ